MNSFYFYVVKWNCEEEGWKTLINKGLVVAESCAEVAEKLEDYFENVYEITIKMVNDDALLGLSDLYDFLEENGEGVAHDDRVEDYT